MLENFRNLLKRDARVVCVHHKDLDGVVSAIVAKNVFNRIKFVDAKYNDIDDILHRINYDSCDVVLILDISPVRESTFELSDKIFLLDHHETAAKYHNPDLNRIVQQGDSAAKLVLKFFTMLYPENDISHLTDMVELADDYDMWRHKNPDSKKLNLLYFKYWSEEFIARFQDGDVRFNEEESLYLENEAKKVKKFIDTVEFYELDRIKACLVFCEKYPNDVCDHALKVEGYDLIISRNPKTSNVSVRCHNHPEIHLGQLLSELSMGGGHQEAAGFHEEDFGRFQRKVELIESEIYNRFPMMRKN